MDLNSNNANGLTDGTYLFDANDDRNAFTLTDGIIFEKYNFDSEAGTRYDASSGTVEIKNDGNETEVDFELNLQNGTTIEGNWKGALLNVASKSGKM